MGDEGNGRDRDGPGPGTDTDGGDGIATGQRPGGANTDRGPEDLESLREEIREIDRDLVDLIARRTYVADTIARVKAAEGLPTTDEAQEERVMARAAEYAERFEVEPELVKDVFGTLIELNKLEQREQR